MKDDVLNAGSEESTDSDNGEESEDSTADTEIADVYHSETALDEITVYIIQEGDTLSSISKKYYGDSSYGTALGKANRIKDYKSLKIGEYLIIPSREEIKKWE